MEGTGEEMNAAAAYTDMRALGRVLSRLSFSMLTPLQVFSGRLVRPGFKEGDSYKAIVYAGAPPGIALAAGRLGFARSVGVNPEFLLLELSPEVETAISWLVRGIN